MMNKKRLLSIIGFGLVFSILFVNIQKVVNYKGWPEDIQYRYGQYERESSERQFDFLITGTSPTYVSLNPMFMWDEEGITSFNFCMSMNTPMMIYHELRCLLEMNCPKVLVVECSNFFRRQDAPIDLTNPLYEHRYRIVYETLPDRKVAEEFLTEALETNPEMNKWNWWFPIFRYHDRWSELTEEDFQTKTRYKDYWEGALCNINTVEANEDAWYEDSFELHDEMIVYYEKIVELCNEKGVKVAFYIPPKKSRALTSEHISILQQWCDERNIQLLSYMGDENFDRLGLDVDVDYYDDTTVHTNLKGCEKVSRDFATKMKELFQFEDKRNRSNYQDWNSNFRLFMEEFQEFLGHY